MKKRSHHALLRLVNASCALADHRSAQRRDRHGHGGRQCCPTAQHAAERPPGDALRGERDEQLLLGDPRKLASALVRGIASRHVDLKRRSAVALDLGDQRRRVQDVPVGGAQLFPRGHLRRARDVREGALAREGMVHPLGEETAMNRHLSTVPLGDLVKALQQWRRQCPRGVHRGRGQPLDELHDAARGRIRGADVLFQRLQQGLALVDAADGVELGARQTVRWAVDVVRDDDARLRRVRLVENAMIPQVLLGFGVLEAAIQSRAIEVLQENPARGAILMFHQVRLQRDALAILPSAVPVSNLL
mmetsp:Transcript_4881/g.14229  ORF Transcript_4881/g.14229 Transcript_4881/m.14229 type:complete len:304 (+) Transcript_4881:70-981(+)